MRSAALVAALLPFLSGCSWLEGEPAATETNQSRTQLSIFFEKTASGLRSEFVLKCNPPAGNVPDAARICEDLEERPRRFFSDEPQMICPLPGGVWYGGVSGTYEGRRARATLIPCSDGDALRLRRWMKLVGFSPD